MASISSLVLTGEHILVRVQRGAPFITGDGVEESRIYKPDFGLKKIVQSCYGIAIAVGPSPYMKDDYAATEDMIKAGDLVIFPPTSGFQVPASEGDENEYRIMVAGVVAGIISGT